MSAESERRWRQANPDRERERHRRYRQANLKAVRERERSYRQANPQVRRAQKRREEAHPERHRNRRLRKHGLYPEGWLALFAAQEGLCYLCGEPLPDDPASVHIDHDHRCCGPKSSCPSCRRGLAHIRCNTLLGMAGDDPARLRRIAANLAKAKRRIRPLLPAQPVLFTMHAEPPAPPRRPNPNGHREDPDPGQWEAMTLW